MGGKLLKQWHVRPRQRTLQRAAEGAEGAESGVGEAGEAGAVEGAAEVE